MRENERKKISESAYAVSDRFIARGIIWKERFVLHDGCRLIPSEKASCLFCPDTAVNVYCNRHTNVV